MLNIKLTLNSDRKLVAVETDDFRIKINGNTNADYINMLKPFGVELKFEASKEAELKPSPDLT